VVIARVLGAHGKGVFALLILVPNLLVVFGNLGIGSANLYFLRKKRFNTYDVTANSLTLASAIGLALIAICLLFLNHLESSFLKGIPPEHLLLVIWTAPLGLFINYAGYILLAHGLVMRYNLVALLKSIGAFLGIVSVLMIFARSMQAVLLSWALGLSIAFVFSVIFIRSLTNIKLGLNLNLLKDSLEYGLKAYLQVLLVYLNYQFDMFLVNYLSGAKSVGYYSVAVGIANLIWYIPNAVGTVLFPKLTSLSREEADKLTSTVCRHIILLTCVVSCGLLMVGRLFIRLVYGSEFLASATPLFILLPGVVVMSVFKMLCANFASRGRPILGAYAAAVGLGVNIVLNFVFIPKYNIAGAALASTICYSLATGIAICVFLNISEARLRDIVLLKKADVQSIFSSLFQK